MVSIICGCIATLERVSAVCNTFTVRVRRVPLTYRFLNNRCIVRVHTDIQTEWCQQVTRYDPVECIQFDLRTSVGKHRYAYMPRCTCSLVLVIFRRLFGSKVLWYEDWVVKKHTHVGVCIPTYRGAHLLSHSQDFCLRVWVNPGWCCQLLVVNFQSNESKLQLQAVNILELV